MKKKLFRVGVWLAVWILITVIFVDYFPQHPHIKYMGLLSPFILLTALIEPSDLINGPFPLELVPGIVFWLVVVLLLVFPWKSKQGGLH